MTKEEAIKKAYGNKFYEYAPDENGWSSKIFCDINDTFNKNFTIKNISHVFHKVRPVSLEGIENNNGWTKIEKENLPEQGVIVLGFSEEWIDLDFNPSGQRNCHYVGIYPDIEWTSARWIDYQDTWWNDDETKPTHWMYIENKEKPIY